MKRLCLIMLSLLMLAMSACGNGEQNNPNSENSQESQAVSEEQSFAESRDLQSESSQELEISENESSEEAQISQEESSQESENLENESSEDKIIQDSLLPDYRTWDDFITNSKIDGTKFSLEKLEGLLNVKEIYAVNELDSKEYYIFRTDSGSFYVHPNITQQEKSMSALEFYYDKHRAGLKIDDSKVSNDADDYIDSNKHGFNSYGFIYKKEGIDLYLIEEQSNSFDICFRIEDFIFEFSTDLYKFIQNDDEDSFPVLEADDFSGNTAFADIYDYTNEDSRFISLLKDVVPKSDYVPQEIESKEPVALKEYDSWDSLAAIQTDSAFSAFDPQKLMSVMQIEKYIQGNNYFGISTRYADVIRIYSCGKDETALDKFKEIYSFDPEYEFVISDDSEAFPNDHRAHAYKTVKEGIDVYYCKAHRDDESYEICFKIGDLVFIFDKVRFDAAIKDDGGFNKLYFFFTPIKFAQQYYKDFDENIGIHQLRDANAPNSELIKILKEMCLTDSGNQTE